MPTPAKRAPKADPAATDSSAPARRRGRPRLEDGPVLERQRLVDTLLAITEAEGLQAVNMRRLAQALDVSTRTIYYHVRDKDEMIDVLTDEIVGRNLPDLSSTDWEKRLRNVASSSRRAWEKYPGVAAEVLGRSIRRTDLPHAMAVRGAVLQALRDAGLDEEFVELAYTQFSIVVLGGLVLWEGVQREPERATIRPNRVQMSIDLGLNLLIFGVRRMALKQGGPFSGG